MTLTKDDLVRAVTQENLYSLYQSTKIVETLLEIIKSRLSSGEDVLISSFGKFCVREKLERRGRNPVTGESIMLSPRKVVTFKCSKKLREQINL